VSGAASGRRPNIAAVKPPPTDLELRRAIYELHLIDYVRGAKDEDKGIVSLDVDTIAERLDVEPVTVRGGSTTT
jgi:hypothetical protein